MGRGCTQKNHTQECEGGGVSHHHGSKGAIFRKGKRSLKQKRNWGAKDLRIRKKT